MSSPKPCLGHPTRTDAIIAMRKEGLDTKQIGARIGISTATVSALEHSAGRSKARAKRPAEEHGRTILFPVDVLDRLGPHAAKRGIHPNHLARMIVKTTLDEGLIDSVLDDLEEFDA